MLFIYVFKRYSIGNKAVTVINPYKEVLSLTYYIYTKEDVVAFYKALYREAKTRDVTRSDVDTCLFKNGGVYIVLLILYR